MDILIVWYWWVASIIGHAFSCDERFLAVNRSGGPSRVWDLKSAELVANLPREAVSDIFFWQFVVTYFLCLRWTSNSYFSREKYLDSADFLISLTTVGSSLSQQCKVISRFAFTLLWMKLLNVQNCLVNLRPDSYRILCSLGDYGKIISWNITSWTRIESKKITREAISAFAVSPDGTLVAMWASNYHWIVASNLWLTRLHVFLDV